MNLLEEESAQSIIKDIIKDTSAIERLERNTELENSGIKIFKIAPKITIGIVPIKIDLHNLLEK